MRRAQYRRRAKRPPTQVWHFWPTCHWYPTTKFVSRDGKPGSGELCNECLAKERKAKQ